MKKQIITILLALVTAAGQGQKVVLHMAGNKTFECTVSQLDSIIFEDDGFIIVDEHEWVDLGLPSGTLWATCNVGANSPEEYGDYFAWGETEPKKNTDGTLTNGAGTQRTGLRSIALTANPARWIIRRSFCLRTMLRLQIGAASGRCQATTR